MAEEAKEPDNWLMEPYICPICFYRMDIGAEARGCDKCGLHFCIGCVWYRNPDEQLCVNCLKAWLFPVVRIVTGSSSVTINTPSDWEITYVE
jgi:hypothetical protein